MALEKQKGSKSKHALWMKSLPAVGTLKDRVSSNPGLTVMKTFGAIPSLHKLYQFIEKAQNCYKEWQQGDPDVQKLPWDSVLHFFIFFLSHGHGNTNAVLPFMDLLNTDRSQICNAQEQVIYAEDAEIPHTG